MDLRLSEQPRAKDELVRLVGNNRALTDDFNNWASAMGLQRVVESKETDVRAERVAKIKAEYGAQGWNEGFVIGGRDLLRRQAEHHFGPATANRLAELLENESDAERLAEVGYWMLECGHGEELVRRLER